MLKNYLAPLGTDITKEYLPCSLSPSFGDYHLDYMVAENANGKKYVAWPGRVSRPVSGVGTTLFATNDIGMSVERRNGSFVYRGGTGATPWGTNHAGQLILGLKDKYSTNTLSPGDTVPYMKIVQSETYSQLHPLLTRCLCQFVTQQEQETLLDRATFLGCTNGLYIAYSMSSDIGPIEVGGGVLLSATAALSYPKMFMKYAYRQNGIWKVPAYPTEATFTKYFEQDGSHYYYASSGITIANSGDIDIIVVGFPYTTFEYTDAVNRDGFEASINSAYLHIV